MRNSKVLPTGEHAFCINKEGVHLGVVLANRPTSNGPPYVVAVAGTIKDGFIVEATASKRASLVDIYGSDNVPPLNSATIAADKLLDGQQLIFGCVSNVSDAHARQVGDIRVVQRSSRVDLPFLYDGGMYRYCVAYDAHADEVAVTEERDVELLQAGDLVECITDDLPNLMPGRSSVYFNGTEMVVFDNEGFELSVQEQIELGYFILKR